MLLHIYMMAVPLQPDINPNKETKDHSHADGIDYLLPPNQIQTQTVIEDSEQSLAMP